MFCGSIVPCLAATGEIKAEITANRAYGRYVCGETGHRLTVTVHYREIGPDGRETPGSVSDSQFGNVTTVVATRNSPSGYRYTFGWSEGFVDGKSECVSPTTTVK